MQPSATAGIVREHIHANPILSAYLSRGWINIAELSRALLPVVRKENPKATVESIAVAVKRLRLDGEDRASASARVAAAMQISTRTDVSLVVCPREAFTLPRLRGDELFAANIGSEEATMLVDSRNADRVPGSSVTDGLVVISLRDTRADEPENFRTEPGVLSRFLSALALAGIPVVDVFTGTHGFRIAVAGEYLTRAHDALIATRDSAATLL